MTWANLFGVKAQGKVGKCMAQSAGLQGMAIMSEEVGF